jgi:hypothetical protein
VPKLLQRILVLLGCVAVIGAGTSLAIASKGGGGGGSTDTNAATTQYAGGQGCTPGYWKNNASKKEAVSWVTYKPGEYFDTVFGVSFLGPKVTLEEALELGGGGYNALARHAVAALLNSTQSSISFHYATAEVIALVKEAESTGEPEPIKNELAAANETTCPISAKGEVTE